MITEPRFPAHIASLRPHIAGVSLPELARRHGLQERDIAKLDSNENPLGASPLALQALAETRQDPSIYPDTDSSVLVSRLAEVYGLDADWIVVGAGSESLLGITVTTLLAAGRKTVYSQYSFVAYANAVQRVGAVAIVVPEPDFMVDLAALHDALAQQPVLIYIANPGNPTGTCVAPEALREFLHAVPPNVVVLLDEAYLEFMPPSLRPDALALVRALPNLIVTRTFSKAYGLAGLRVGYAIAQPALAGMLRRVRPLFTVTQAAQIAALAALSDQPFLQKAIAHNESIKQFLLAGLRELQLPYLESHTNFVLVKVGDGAALAQRLAQRGLLVRPVGLYGLPQWTRIGVGTQLQIEHLLHALRQVLRE